MKGRAEEESHPLRFDSQKEGKTIMKKDTSKDKKKIFLDPKWKCGKIFRLGIKKKPGNLYYIAEVGSSKKAAVFSVSLKSFETRSKKRVSKDFDLVVSPEYSYYVDSEGDVSRCLRKFVKKIEKLDWIGGK